MRKKIPDQIGCTLHAMAAQIKELEALKEQRQRMRERVQSRKRSYSMFDDSNSSTPTPETADKKIEMDLAKQKAVKKALYESLLQETIEIPIDVAEFEKIIIEV